MTDKSLDDIQLLLALAGAKDFREFLKQIRMLLSTFGITDFTAIRLNAMGNLDEPTTTLSKDFIGDYAKGGFFEHDLILKHVSSSVIPIFKNKLDQWICSAPVITDSIESNLELLKLNKKYDFFEHYFIPMKAHNGNGKVLFAVSKKSVSSSEFMNLVNKCRNQLSTIALAVDYIGTTRFADQFVKSGERHCTIKVTPRPLLLLDTLANNDISVREAANKLNISLDTANKHISIAKKALECKRLSRTIAKAILEGLVQLRDDDND